MSKRIYVQNRVPQDGASFAEVRNQSSLLRSAKKSLSRYDRNLNPEDLAKVMQALNGITDLLSGRQPKDDDETVANECDCEDGTECDCEEASPQSAVTNAAFARDWESHRGHGAVERELERKSYRENSSQSRELNLVRNATRASASFLDDKDLAEIAARNARARKR